MRHMRSRRILAMLLALSMIFGLLTTTAFAGEVDQNTSNVGESAANGTSEGGSGEGQSSGASEDESSKVTNKEDVPTEEETIPEEKKTTSDEEVDTQEGEGMEVPTATTIATDEALINAINNAVDGDTITLAEGQYQISDLIGLSNANKAVTISAETNATVILNAADGIALHGAKITFNGITFQWGTANYKGIQHASELEYNDCIINGKVFLYAGKETFNHCTFNQDSADYCVWTYGAAETTFNDCTFNCKGKAVLVYNEGYIKNVKVEVNNTTFAASETVDKKAAIELDTHLMKGASITVDNASTATGFSTNTTDGAGLWNAKRIDSENNETVEVVVGGEVKYTLTTAPVAMVNGVSYDKLEDAFAALSDKAYTLTLNDESAWDTATPVYWAAGTQSGYEATLAEALTAAYVANADDITIICRPKADVGEMTHGHVADNLTIYGNDAYISAGECDLEVDTFKFDRNTGKQATDGVTLDKDITITAYELDNLGVWGERHTNHTVNVNLTDCDTVKGITVQRVYISGTTGMNNITLTGCDFETKATSVYSNADGDINITNCSFTGAQVPVNFNHKTDGEQTLRVSNCEFNACGDAGEWKQFAAPVRFVNSGSGKQSATVDTCTFTDTVGPNGDILIGDGRTGQESNDVNLTITDTEAKIQAQKPGYYNGNETDASKLGTATSPASGTLTTSVKALISGGETSDAPTFNADNTITNVTVKNVQDLLDGKYGRIDGKTIVLSAGEYPQLELGRATKYADSNTTYHIGSFTAEALCLEDFIAHKAEGGHYYIRTMENVTFKAEENATVKIAGVFASSGHKYVADSSAAVTDYVLDTTLSTPGSSHYLADIFTNIAFEGITFTAKSDINTSIPEAKYEGFTFKNCVFDINNTASDNQAIRYYNENDDGRVTDLTVDTCTFNSCYQGVYTSHVKNVTVTNSTFDTTGHNAIAIQDFKGACDHGQVVITGNTFKNVGDRIIRFNNVGTGTTIQITGNTSVASGNSKGEIIKAETMVEGVTVDMTSTANTWGDKAEGVPAKLGNGFADSDNVAKVGDTEYATLEAAVAAVTDTNNTITLLTDVIQNTQLALNRSLTLNLDGHTIKNENDIWGEKTYCLLRVEDNAVVTITGNGTVAAKKDDCYAISITSGSLTIENGTFIGNISAVQVETGSLTIKDGTFKQIQESKYGNTYVINCIDGEFASGAATVAIYGGTFVGFDPNVSPEQKVDGVTPSFAAPGVGITKNADGTFTAKAGMAAQVLDATGNSVKAYKTLAEAFTEASEGQTVRLLKDLKEDVTINKNITLDLGGKTLTNTNAGHATISVTGGTVTVKNGSVMGGTDYYNIEVTKGSNANLTLEDVTATAGNNGSSMIDNWGTLTITSGTYTGGLNVVKSEEDSTLVINGGTFTLDYATNGYTGVILVYGDTTITGGEFIQSLTTTGRWNHPQVIATGVVEGHPAITRVTGGMFTNKMSGEGIFRGIGKATSDNFEVSGGTFNKSISDAYCADGFIPTKNADGTYGVKEGKYVAKIGSTSYETLAAAIAKATSKSKPVTLVADVTESIEIAESKTCKIDLNGFTLTNTEGSHTIVNNGTLTIMDSSAAKNGTVDNVTNARAAIVNYGTMTLAGGTYTRSLENPENNKDSGGGNSFYTILNDKGGSLTIKDGVTVTNVGHFSSMICNGGNEKDSTLTIEGGNFSGGINTIKNDEFGKLTINGGSFTNATQCVVMNWNEASITDGTFELASGVNSTLLFSVAWSDHAIGKMTISGGTFKYTETQGLVQDTYDSGKYTGTLAVSGGTFSSAVLPKYCAEGYIPADKGDGTYGVKEGTYVAEVNGKQYETLQAAIDAASKNQTVKLIADTTENVTMKTPYLTLDLNGHTLNGGQVKGKPALTVTARVTVKDSSADMSGTIMREDTEDNSGVSSHYVIDVQGAGWLTFESGNVINNSGIPGVKGASLVRVGDDTVAKYPGLNIKGGNFQQDNFIAIKVDRGTLHLLGGEINSANSYAIENWNNAYIKGGTVNGTVSSWVYSTGVAFSKLEISGGTVNGNVASVNYDSAADKQARIYITGGEVTGTLGTYTYSNRLVPTTETAMATVEVTGGTFDKDPTTYVVEGSTVNKNSEGKFGVEKAYLCKIGEKQYYTMDEAFHAVQAGETITMLRNYTTDKIQNSGSASFTIDLNGHTWTANIVDVNSAAFEINYSDVTLTVKNGKVISSQLVGLIPSAMSGTITYNSSGLVFEGVEATANGHSGIETNGNNTNDTVTLKNSTLNVPNGYGIYFPSSGKLTIDNSKITAMTLGVQVCSGSLDIKGQNAAITVNGDPVPKTENDGAIQDGAAISIVNRTGYKGLDKITVTGGTFKAKSGNAAVKAYDWANQTASNFTASDKVAISGGSYSTAVPEDLCAEGFVPVTNGDGTYGVQPDGNVAEIGSVKYASLDEALKAAKDRETVKLLKDVEATQVLVTKGTLDLNGKTLKVSYFMSFSDVIDSTDGNGLIETGVQSFFTTNNSYLPLRDSAANGYRLFSYKLNKLGVVEGSSTAFWFNIVFGGKKAYSLLNTAGHNADLFIPMQIGSGNEWQYIKMNQSTLTKWTTPILNGTAPSKCGYYVNITGLDTLTSGTVLTLKTSIRSCGVEKLSDDSLTYTVK